MYCAYLCHRDCDEKTRAILSDRAICITSAHSYAHSTVKYNETIIKNVMADSFDFEDVAVSLKIQGRLYAEIRKMIRQDIKTHGLTFGKHSLGYSGVPSNGG